MMRLFSFSELKKTAQDIARTQLLAEIAKLPWYRQRVKAFVTSIADTGIIIDPKEVYVTPEYNVSFSVKEVTLGIVLHRSGIRKKYLTAPGYYDLFCANTKVDIKRIRPFSSDLRMISISVSVALFDNNDNGRALFVCETAASLLEPYLNHLLVTISDSFRNFLIEEYAYISSPAFLDAYLNEQGMIFLESGNFDPVQREGEI